MSANNCGFPLRTEDVAMETSQSEGEMSRS